MRKLCTRPAGGHSGRTPRHGRRAQRSDTARWRPSHADARSTTQPPPGHDTRRRSGGRPPPHEGRDEPRRPLVSAWGPTRSPVGAASRAGLLPNRPGSSPSVGSAPWSPAADDRAAVEWCGRRCRLPAGERRTRGARCKHTAHHSRPSQIHHYRRHPLFAQDVRLVRALHQRGDHRATRQRADRRASIQHVHACTAGMTAAQWAPQSKAADGLHRLAT